MLGFRDRQLTEAQQAIARLDPAQRVEAMTLGAGAGTSAGTGAGAGTGAYRQSEGGDWVDEEGRMVDYDGGLPESTPGQG